MKCVFSSVAILCCFRFSGGPSSRMCSMCGINPAPLFPLAFSPLAAQTPAHALSSSALREKSVARFLGIKSGNMGEARTPARMFLWSMAAVYLFAFASIYIQIPGLYGDEGVVPVRLSMPRVQSPLLEQLQAAPSLLWLGPTLGLGPQQCLEIICLLGVLLSLGAVLIGALRDSVVYLCLWALYLSLYTVGGDFLHSEWDSLLLEAGFLAVLVAPLGLLRRSSSAAHHDSVTFWLTRWLLFRLVFSTGVSKLASGDPSWWDLTALSRHFETQASPTPLAWYAHQLPDWLSRLGAVCIMAEEIAVPLLMFFAPIRGLRISAFYIQVSHQLCLMLLGGSSLLHLLTIALSFSLLDDEQFNIHKKKTKTKTWGQFLGSFLILLVKLAVYALIVVGAIILFKLEINWEKKTVTSKTDFSHKAFDNFLSQIQTPTIWVGVLSLTWEVVAAMLKCVCARGILNKLLALIQWAIFTAAAVGVFTLSLVPYTAMAGLSGKILPGVRKAFSTVENYQLVGAYGIQHRMVPPAGRPEIIIEGSTDKKSWTELSFMYKPDSLTKIPPVVGPHQPRLDWLLWEAARGEHDQNPWFTGLVNSLLEGKADVVNLLQVDEAQYPFSQTPPTFIRARVYHYHFTQTAEDGTHPQAWWKRQYVREFFPVVQLGDQTLEGLLKEAGLKEKFPVQPISDSPVTQALSVLRGQVRGICGPLVLLTLFATVATILLLKSLFSRTHTSKGPKPRPSSSEHKSKKPKEAPEASEKNRPAPSRGGKKDHSEERKLDSSDRSPRKRK
ncbi:lipase maturation factor 2 [Astyanax mexicanus]|uniref:Lipase maturation factor n=1 Tax=Astyanax mexicanus TaxID=7994 RepID=A0A8B9L194_ASTMX|nr:lipase maturation factor 2 [Astyanax mexicanus]